MRRYVSLPVGLSLVIALALLAAHPFLTRPGLPRNTDAELHVFRAAELGHALRGGAGYVRWAPDLWYGYGYPIFNYYSPLTYYLANALALLPGLDIVGGTKAVFILGLILAATGAFSLGRDLFGPRAGLVAAAAYVFSPYLLFIDPHTRGDLPEFFALALFPWLLRFRTADFVVSAQSNDYGLRPAFYAILWAALILTHNLMALILSTIFVTWLLGFRVADCGHLHLRCASAQVQVLQIADERRTTNDERPTTNLQSPISNLHAKRPISNLQLILLAAGLSAFFWLPFIAERDAVQLTVVGPGHFDFHNHFVAWRALFGASQPLDMGATALKFKHNLGLAQWVLALPAIPLAFFHRRKPQGRALLFFVSCALFLIFLMLSPSTFIWEHVPLMSYIQFPWRLLGPTALMLAMCIAGVTFHACPERSRRISRITPVLSAVEGSHVSRITLHAPCILILLASALPTMYPPLWPPDFGPTTPYGILQVELKGRYLGTTSTGDFVPSTVATHPPANPDLLASYERGVVDKFDRSTLPPGGSASLIEHGPRHDHFTLNSPQPFTARVLTFYFPGWRVWVDGQPVPIRPSDPYGLIEFDAPAGQHDVLVAFGSTPPRTIGTIISLLTLLAIGFKISNFKFQIAGRRRTANGESPISTRSVQSPTSNLQLELIVIALFALFKLAVADPCDTCFRYTSPPGQALSAQYPLSEPVDFGHHIALLGYDLPSNQVRSGGKLALTLYWKATTPVPRNYQVFAHLVRPATTLWGQSDKLNPGDFPTTRWPLDKFVWDEHVLALLPGTPPGEYQLSVGLYTLEEGLRVPVFNASGQAVGDSFSPPVTVRVLPAPTRAGSLRMDKREKIAYNGATLLGHALESAQVRAPGFVRVTLFWQAGRDAPSQPARVEVTLADVHNRAAAHLESEPTGGIHPPARWKRGQIVRDIYSLWLDDRVRPGTYRLHVTIDGGEPLEVGQVEILGANSE